MPSENKEEQLMSFGDHLEVLRRMLFRIVAIMVVLGAVIFCFKDTTWAILLAPSEWDFCTYRWIEQLLQALGFMSASLPPSCPVSS